MPEEKNTYAKLASEAMAFPRYSFRLTMSALSKLIKKQWGKIVEDLIFEKPRRKSSSNASKNSKESSGEIRNRLKSLDGQQEMLEAGGEDMKIKSMGKSKSASPMLEME